MDSDDEPISRALTPPGVSNDFQLSARRNSSPPREERDFSVAILCALPLEASAVSALFDTRWEARRYRKAPGDHNSYSVGIIGHHNVVLVHMPQMGKVAAAAAAASLRSSFHGITLALVVGVCGGAPYGKDAAQELFLGDVVVSEGMVQSDFGKRYPTTFERKDTLRDNLPRPGPTVRAALAQWKAEQSQGWLHDQRSDYLSTIQQRLGDIAKYPGEAEDRLIKSIYRHKHHEPTECATCASEAGRDEVCDAALHLSCQQLKCDLRDLMPRNRLSAPNGPALHFGLIASADTVMKSADDRDAAIKRDDVIAFEMEGAGVWETISNCLVIKGVCDYADSHKSKTWQGYAAATAAAAAKAFLRNWDPGKRPCTFIACRPCQLT